MEIADIIEKIYSYLPIKTYTQNNELLESIKKFYYYKKIYNYYLDLFYENSISDIKILLENDITSWIVMNGKRIILLNKIFKSLEIEIESFSDIFEFFCSERLLKIYFNLLSLDEYKQLTTDIIDIYEHIYD